MGHPARRSLAVVTLVLASAAVRAGAAAAGPSDLPVPEATADQVSARADEIVARPEFRPPPRSILERVLGFVVEQLAKVLEPLLGGSRGAVAAWVLGGLALLALGFFVLRFVRGMRRDPASREREMDDPRRPPADWRGEAERHEAKGEWKSALRCRYRALVADLAERGLVEEVPGRTAGEYRLDVRAAAPALAADFAAATELFELAWYGDRPTGEAGNARFRALADAVLAGAPA